jgi:hypothetical protein
MKLSHKALLYSALIFPGGGHFLLRRYLAGSLLAGAAFACLVVLVMRAIDAAQKVSEQILMGEIPLDIASIREAITTQAAVAESQATTIATWLLVACWIVAAIDAWRLGRRAERNESRRETD